MTVAVHDAQTKNLVQNANLKYTTPLLAIITTYLLCALPIMHVTARVFIVCQRVQLCAMRGTLIEPVRHRLTRA